MISAYIKEEKEKNKQGRKLKSLVHKTRGHLERKAASITATEIHTKEHEISIMQEELDALVVDCNGIR